MASSASPSLSRNDDSVLGAIGSTSIVRLRKVVPANSADVTIKLEAANPTGPTKTAWPWP